MKTKKLFINADKSIGTLEHYWKKVVAGSHGTTALRCSFQNALKEVREKNGFEEVRFHGILSDDMGLYDEDENGNVKCNFYHLDTIFDSLLEIGMRPFVELGFMPEKLRSTDKTVFWWKGNISLPNNKDKYQETIRQFVSHLLARYGKEEVANWKFEVWNEPNLGGFKIDNQDMGYDEKTAYFELYRLTVEAIKDVDPELKVGGPASARCDWIKETIEFCEKEKLPLDFVTTHLYCQDNELETVADWVANGETSKYQVIPEYVKASVGPEFMSKSFAACKEIIKNSSMPDIPLYITEYNSFWEGDCEHRDSEYNAPFVLETVHQCKGIVDGLAYWTFSDDFEERGVGATEFNGNFGLVTRKGLFKPAFIAYQMLNRLGNEELEHSGDLRCFATKSPDEISLIVWNNENESFDLELMIEGLKSNSMKHYRIDKEHSNAYRKWREMGSPECPKKEELAILKKHMKLEIIESSQESFSRKLKRNIKMSPYSASLIVFSIDEQ
jgi:xylan 1,4-beta-xylosidase